MTFTAGGPNNDLAVPDSEVTMDRPPRRRRRFDGARQTLVTVPQAAHRHRFAGPAGLAGPGRRTTRHHPGGPASRFEADAEISLNPAPLDP